MNLFGCKFCDRDAQGNKMFCDRKNFDSLLWATVTVFQVCITFDVLFLIAFDVDLCISFSVLDSYARRLEHSVVSWYAKDKSLGSPLFCGLDDLWKLRTVQSPSGHFGGRVFQSSKAFHNHLHCFTHSFIITNIKSLKFVYCSKLNIFTHYHHHRQSLFYFHSLLLCTYYCC